MAKKKKHIEDFDNDTSEKESEDTIFTCEICGEPLDGDSDCYCESCDMNDNDFE